MLYLLFQGSFNTSHLLSVETRRCGSDGLVELLLQVLAEFDSMTTTIAVSLCTYTYMAMTASCSISRHQE